MIDERSANDAPDDALDASESSVEAVTLFSGKLREAIENIPQSLRLCPEQELIDRANPSATDWNLRRNFHNKVNAALLAGEIAITTTSIYEGIQAKQHFFANTICNPNKIAFIYRPVVEHVAYYDAIHQIGLGKLLRYVEEATINEKNFSLIAKLVDKAGDRVHGAVAQKMQIQSKNLNIEANARDINPQSQGAEDVQSRINDLQRKLLSGGMKDVSNSSSEDPS